MTKEEKIKEAWDNIDGLNTNIWANYWTYEKAKKHGIDKDGWIKVYGYELEEGTVCDFIRPPQLQGIEDNNGWIKIESEDDLPKEEFNNVWIKHNDGDILIMQCSNTYLLKNCTHYQPIEKPKPPIY